MDRAQRVPGSSTPADLVLSVNFLEAGLGVFSLWTVIKQMGRLSLRLRGAQGLSESWAELELESRC